MSRVNQIQGDEIWVSGYQAGLKEGKLREREAVAAYKRTEALYTSDEVKDWQAVAVAEFKRTLKTRIEGMEVQEHMVVGFDWSNGHNSALDAVLAVLEDSPDD